MKIIFYTKTGCPWCKEMKNYLDQKQHQYEEKNVTENPEFFEEMKNISGQVKAPTLIIDGKVYADVGVDDIKGII
jgi:glutaredoxin